MADDEPVGQAPSIWRDRNVVLALTGGTVNDIGDWMIEIALPVFVYEATGSGKATAAIYIVYLAFGVLLGPLGGSLADRWNLRTTLVATNVLQALALLPMLAASEDRVWPAFVVVGAQALIAQVNNPASFAVFPRLLSGERLVKANAAASNGGSIARLVGAPLGGLALAAGGLSVVAVADLATFVIAGLSIALIPDSALRLAGDPVAEIDDAAPVARDTSVRSGWKIVKAQPALLALIAVNAVSQLAFTSFPVLFIVFVADELDGGGTEVGWIRACAAFGGIVAATLVGRIAGRHHPAKLMTAGYLLFGVVGLGFVNAPSVTHAFWVYLVLFGLSGFPNVTSQIGQRSTAQMMCPPEVLGRLSGLFSAVGAVGAGVGAIAAALLIDVVPVRVLFNAQTECFTICGLIGYFFIVRRLDHGREPTEIR
jgi:MFS family permease